MTPATRWLIAAGASAWVGAAWGRSAGGLPPLPAAAAAVLALIGGRFSRRPALWGLAGLLLAFAALSGNQLSAPKPQAAQSVAGRLVGIENLAAGWIFEIAAPGKNQRVFLPRSGDPALDRPPDGLRPGAIVSIPLKSEAASERTGPRRGLVFSTVEVRAPPQGWGNWATLGDRWAFQFRQRCRARLLRGDPDPVGGFLLATVAGDGRQIGPREWRELKASGLAHLAVVSGFNVGWLALAAGLLIVPVAGTHSRALRSIRLGAVLALLILLPADPPVRRAGWALLFANTGRLLGRGVPPAGALAQAVLGLLAVEPSYAGSLSFALTVSATGALVLARPRPKPWCWILALLAPAMATWPILVEATGRTSPWFLPANALVIPAVLPAMAGGWLAALLPEGAPGFLNGAATGTARASAGFVLAVARWTALLPGSGRIAAPTAFSGETAALPLWLVVHELLVLGALRARRGQSAAFLLLLAGLSWAWPLRFPPTPEKEPPAFTVVDVGQGSAALWTGPGGPVLIDAGDDRKLEGTAALIDELRRRGIRRLELLALSHADRDHAGGAAQVLAAAPPRQVVLPASSLDDPAWADLISEAADRGIPVAGWSAGRVWGRGPLSIACRWPPAGRIGTGNDLGLVLWGGWPGFKAWVPGDAGNEVEAALQRQGVLLPVEVFVAGHHGSQGCSSRPFLERLAPGVALISYGADNPYGHPHPAAVKRLVQRAGRVLGTGGAGSVQVTEEAQRRLILRRTEGLAGAAAKRCPARVR